VTTAVAAPVEPRGLGIQRRLVELGRIRLGEKGSKGEPKRLSKFRLTSASRPLLEAARRVYGGTAVRAWQGAPDEGMWELYTDADSIDVMVPPTINAYSQFYEVWDAGGCSLRCDGNWESIAEEPCSHDHTGDQLAPNGQPWKVTTRVSVILPKLPGIGTWRLETHGWNAASTLPATLDLIGQAGRWIPAVIRLEQRSSTTRDEKTGRALKRRFVVPVIDLAGVSFFEMLEAGQVSDAYEQPGPALGAGPGSLALPPGPARPPASTRVTRPPMAEEPPLEDETAPLSTPVDRAFPEEPADDAVFAAAPTPPAEAPAAEPELALGDRIAAQLKFAAAPTPPAEAPAAEPELALGDRIAAQLKKARKAEREAAANDEQREALAQAFSGVPGPAIIAGVRHLFPTAVGEDGRAHLSQAEAAAVLVAVEAVGAEAFRTSWTALATGTPA
jgi:hypothetical protein